MKKLLIILAFAGVVFAGCDLDENYRDLKKESESESSDSGAVLKDSTQRKGEVLPEDKPKRKRRQYLFHKESKRVDTSLA
ncbi:hypothetical protein [Pedobacter hartonius]|uniref:Lipoprotein n=1 Tax=Pedobacter hartonius TaxID=425514 RepID=A0A1H4GZI7_9SPHI|nr:hypothetical protein [Pedobacter hartonius]SEB14995.1 hypothetical protein SAMN05443550_11296 [Pedobacter hartonius]